jgi:integrase
MGSGKSGIRAASQSSIEIEFMYKGARFKERIKLVPNAANLKYAANLRARIRDDIARGFFDYAAYFPDSKRAQKFSKIPGSAIRITQAIRQWLDSVENQIEHTTYRDYQLAIERVWVPLWGTWRLTELNRTDLKAWIATQSCSLKRIRNLLLPLRGTFAQALEDGLISQNPFTGWTPRKKSAPKDREDIDPFSQEEIGAILGACDGQIQNLFKFAFWTGLRTSELIGLEWQDVDLVSRIITVRRAFVRKRKKTPKTRASRRSIQLLEPAYEALLNQRKLNLIHDSVFLNPRTNQPWVGDAPIRRTAWQPALQRAGVRYRYPYQTRHTFASTVLTAGENPIWVAKVMGHADWTMIARIYGRWIPSIAPEAGKKVERLWNLTNSERSK